MLTMVVTLEVSKLSGWLNAFAFCRESEGGHAVWGEGQRPGRQEAAGDRGARSVQRRELDCRVGGGPGEERTPNMPYMLVTLEVSKLSGWLNAFAFCRESKGGHTVRGEVRAWRREAAGERGASRAQRRLDCRYGAGHGEERTPNI